MGHASPTFVPALRELAWVGVVLSLYSCRVAVVAACEVSGVVFLRGGYGGPS